MNIGEEIEEIEFEPVTEPAPVVTPAPPVTVPELEPAK